MRDTLGHGLEWYDCSQKLRPFNADFEENESPDDNVLTICMDEEQKQLAGFFYLERKISLNLTCAQKGWRGLTTKKNT